MEMANWRGVYMSSKLNILGWFIYNSLTLTCAVHHSKAVFTLTVEASSRVHTRRHVQ